MPNPPLFEIANPFQYNPTLDQSQNNFIQEGISKGIEKGLGNVGDKILNAGQVKAQSFAQNLPELATLALISYFIYLGYKSFIKRDVELDLSKIYPITMIYIIFRLIWKVILHI